MVVHPVRLVHPGDRRLIHPEHVVLFDIRQQEQRPGVTVLPAAGPRVRETPGRVVIVVHGEAELLEVVLALQACGGGPHLLDGGEEQADEDRNNRYHHQQLDQGERTTRTTQRRTRHKTLQ